MPKLYKRDDDADNIWKEFQAEMKKLRMEQLAILKRFEKKLTAAQKKKIRKKIS